MYNSCAIGYNVTLRLNTGTITGLIGRVLIHKEEGLT